MCFTEQTQVKEAVTEFKTVQKWAEGVCTEGLTEAIWRVLLGQGLRVEVLDPALR